MKNQKTISISVRLLLFVLLLSFGIWQWQSAKGLELNLKATREKAYFSALDGLTNIETDLGKVIIAQSSGQHALLFGRIASIALSAAENLSALPSIYGADPDGFKFLSQTADYTQSLASVSAEGRELSERDVEQLSILKQKCGELKIHLASGADFVYDAKLDTGESSGIDYPMLLYDGPFSDGIHMGKAKGLIGGEVSAEEAVEIATAFIGTESVKEAVRSTDTGGPVPTYGVLLKLADIEITASVTRQSGKILWMAPESAGFVPRLDIDECVLHAKAFLTSRGFGEMAPSYHQQYDGLAVISFAAVQDEVTLYTDLVKVQVRMDTGAVIGIEANNYWMNHTHRERLHPKLQSAEARQYVSKRLSIDGEKLCVIPVDDGLGTGRTEILCWEFDGVAEENRYLVYIDAETGREVNVLKVVLGNGGMLTI